MELRRVVITGVGAITPIGNDAETFWRNLLAGKSGIGPITHFDASRHSVRVAGEIKGFDPSKIMDHRAARRSGRTISPCSSISRRAMRRSDASATPSGCFARPWRATPRFSMRR